MSEDEWWIVIICYYGEIDYWRKKRWVWNFGIFFVWLVKYGNFEGNFVFVKLGFVFELKRKKFWLICVCVIIINRFYMVFFN